ERDERRRDREEAIFPHRTTHPDREPKEARALAKGRDDRGDGAELDDRERRAAREERSRGERPADERDDAGAPDRAEAEIGRTRRKERGAQRRSPPDERDEHQEAPRGGFLERVARRVRHDVREACGDERRNDARERPFDASELW